MSSDEQLRCALTITLAARTRHAIREGALMLFVETREMAALLGVPYGEPDLTSATADMAIDVAGMEQARRELDCEADTSPMKPVSE